MEYEDITILTPRLVLRRMTTDDAQGIFAYASDPLITRYVIWESHRDLEDTHAYIGTVLDGYARGEMCDWVVVRGDTGDILGTCGFVDWNRANRRAEIGYVIARAQWNGGYATEAVRAAMGFGFARMQLERIEAQVMPENVASERVMLKLGMRCEGVLRARMRARGAQHNVKIYSMLKEEYAP
jgi:[ribosomal protein S5]-alanine N-acetyltransferase